MFCCQSTSIPEPLVAGTGLTDSVASEEVGATGAIESGPGGEENDGGITRSGGEKEGSEAAGSGQGVQDSGAASEGGCSTPPSSSNGEGGKGGVRIIS